MITRFAPSPTGPLHLGHAFSAMTAHDLAQAAGGTFLLRIEDLDQSRSKPHWEAQIFDDLAWLGLHWPTPVLRQSSRMRAYREALDRLWKEGLLYPCECSRRDIQEAASAPQEGVQLGPDGIVYPGTCRGNDRTGPLPDGTLRLDMAMALDRVGSHAFEEIGAIEAGVHPLDPDLLRRGAGDVVLARKHLGASYHLSVVLDDAYQSVTHVVRGVDLFDATAIHVLLQLLLSLKTPIYHHHRLIRDETGRRLAKREDARAIRRYREGGTTAADIRTMVMNAPH